MNSVARQIQRRMEALDLNARSLALKAKINETGVRDIIEGRSRNPRSDTLAKLARALGCAVADLTEERPPAGVRRRRDTEEVVVIPELDVHATAGLGADDGSTIMAAHESASVVGTHAYPINSFREAYGFNPDRIRIVAVRGNSMEPELWPGQRVMVDVEDKTPSPPGIFVVWDGLGLVMKYVEVVANSEPLRVRISSAHPAFKPYERNIDEAHINGRVVGVWAKK